MDAPIIRYVPQRHEGDCSVACLAMVCGVSYEQALIALGKQEPHVCKRGAWSYQMRNAAKALGFATRSRRKFDLESDHGILGIKFKAVNHEHVVVLWEGRIIDTDFGLYMADVYFSVNEARPTSLLVVEREAT